LRYDNTGLDVRYSETRERGLIANRIFKQDELVLCAPVQILDVIEYQMLSLMPAVLSFHDQNNKDHNYTGLIETLGALAENPPSVLGCDQTETSSRSAIMYTFSWDRPEAEGGPTVAIAFGIMSMCNHAQEENSANAKIVQNGDTREIELVATRDISPGEEIFLRYRSTPFLEE